MIEIKARTVIKRFAQTCAVIIAAIASYCSYLCIERGYMGSVSADGATTTDSIGTVVVLSIVVISITTAIGVVVLITTLWDKDASFTIGKDKSNLPKAKVI